MVAAPLANVLLCLVLLPLAAAGQATGPSLRAVKARYDAKRHRVALTCQLINGDSAQTFYKPTTWDYCARLSFLRLQDVKTRMTVSYFPCTYVADLDHVPLTAANTVVLGPKAAYAFTQYVKASHLRPGLVRGHTYTVYFSLSHQYLCGGRDCRAFQGSLRSNPVTLTIP
ncbi:hypothetical protein [Hymenobacter arizonensis]|uniref:Uncharacterized protein n=1 Tax=Hymenobacter arizonensis TaxID=1227077 RepID=A0A1I6BCT5_HYMAR|nr:hypothetical protein [Hymenobacter arizonensis]SFQ78704.1 hypothetical protein SAMN04515668_4353 [Hymenobacter arizonensis]